MFGRGNWAIVGIAKESLKAFKTSLEDRVLMIAVSQLAASAVTRHIKVDALGINPFGSPRLDEEHEIGIDHEQELAQFAIAEPETRTSTKLSAKVLDGEGYGLGEQSFEINAAVPWYGLWVAANEWKDIGDLLSIKEQHAYAAQERPYKFLSSSDKKAVDQDVRRVTAAKRKQFPVLLDFNEGRAYIENTSQMTIFETGELLKRLGVDIISIAWTYNRTNWPAEILNKLYENTHFLSDFQKRADEATRFKPKEIEKLEDKELESIVANYFSMTQLPSDLWVGISGPAQTRLQATGQPLVAKAPTSATALLGMTNDAHLLSGSLTFQERITYLDKKGEGRTFRKDVLKFALNDKINHSDAGAAMLRGFDVPAFKKELQREIKKTKQVPSIDEFWSSWLQEMSNAVRIIEASFRDILGLDGEEKAGILPTHAPLTEELLELETA